MIKFSRLKGLVALSLAPAFFTTSIQASNKADASKQKKKNVILVFSLFIL